MYSFISQDNVAFLVKQLKLQKWNNTQITKLKFLTSAAAAAKTTLLQHAQYWQNNNTSNDMIECVLSYTLIYLRNYR
jgi:hypothetical protein